MHPDPYTDDVKHEEFLANEPKYLQGWQAGLAHITDTTHLTDKIDNLQQLLVLNQDCIKRLKNKIAELEMSWYRKLLNKLPSIRIEWKTI